jgi:DNA topoisomerase-1
MPTSCKLYDLIWKRATASQMASAEIERTTVEITASKDGKTAGCAPRVRSSASTASSPPIPTPRKTANSRTETMMMHALPEINAREALAREKINATQHFTEPPPRYSEASLIKKMEELGIGRPSTYASTLATLRDRDYVVIDKRKLIPEAKGRLVIAFLENFFERYVEFGFTADLEEKLDRISAGELAWKDVLREFWTQFHAHIDDTKELRVSQVLDALNEALAPLVFPVREDGSNPRICPTCGTGNLSLKLGKYGAFVGCSNYPDCNFTRQLSADQDCGRRGGAVE